MSGDSPSRGPAGPGPALDAEQEVELGRYWWAIVARWWLVALAVALGILVGFLVSLGGGRVFQAKATVYLGQPLSPSGNNQIQTLATNPSAVNQIARSESVVRSVADRVGVPYAELRSGVSTKPVSGSVAKVGQTPLVEVIVRGPWKRQAADAANLLADVVVERVSTYPKTKIEKLDTLLTGLDDQLESIEGAVGEYQAAIAAAGTLGPAERLALVGLLNSAVQQRGQLLEERNQTDLELALARDVEVGRVVTQASSTKVAARGKRSSMIVGAVIGLVVGIGLALAWEPVRRRISGAGQA